MAFINIGFGNMIQSEKVLCMVSPDSAPAKRMIAKVRQKDDLIDATQGRKTRCVLVADSGQVVLSALQPDTIAARIKESNNE